MKTEQHWFRQLVPWLLAASLAANAYLGLAVWQRDRHANWLLWGNTAYRLMWHFNNASISSSPEGRISSLTVAEDLLESLQSLPYYSRRVDQGDLQSMLRFLRYAKNSISLSAREQQETGAPSAESLKRLDRIHAALEGMLQTIDRVNDLKDVRYTWNHGAWRAMWHDMALGLEQIELVPLPE